MSENEVAKLHRVLSNGERQLENIKFFPGSNRGLTTGEISRAATVALENILSKPLVDAPPMSGRAKTSIEATR